MPEIQAIGPNQEKLLAALESGEWDQGTGQLCYDDKYCCLGVGCEVFGVTKHYAMYNANAIHFGANCDATGAPDELIELLALRSHVGDSLDGTSADSLNELNDSGKTFAEIAAIIRRDPGQYFTEPR